MSDPKTLGRLAGLCYLAVAVFGGFAELFVRDRVRVPGDAAATAANITADETLFRLGLAADLLMAIAFILLGLTLHRLLHETHRRAATALLVLVTGGATAILANLVFHAGALLVATDPAYDSGLALLLLDLHHHGYVLGGVLFGLWLLPMAYVAMRSALFPTALGVLVLAGVVTWLADPLLFVAAPGLPETVRTVVSVPTSLAEFSLLLYLLIVGVRRTGQPLDQARVDSTTR
ncbi:hypothetical protein CS0771_40820 [Catellatospora sp. IY07-71]|uniref:DUF4386 domain-containing protein n=1 Tax=Catellatospora sp. IY07-71 TaxID=2728827 RepID=UPI001BB300B6|nr:DUF4386 domain-containing protein [Catellatospora sp. IY07-71]BCJ74538.1 hypothetical protein CS0771_40820 [Catellatospora sp. IY07-71]